MSFRIIFVAMTLLVGCSPSSGPAPDKAETGRVEPAVVSVTGDNTIFDEYQGNALAADRAYLNKRVEVALVRGTVRKAQDGRYFIGCEVASPLPPETPPGVRFFLDQASFDKAASTKGLAGFRLVGTCKGRKDDPAAYGGFVVTFDDCHILAVLTYDGKEWKVAAP